MTLILTEASQLGIVMAADSAYTSARTSTVRYGEKLFSVPWLSAGLSFWGGGLPEKPDVWIADFIRDNKSASSIADLGIRLQTDLRRVISPLAKGIQKSTLGFHLAGLSTSGVPVIYHIHNGASATLTQRGGRINPTLVNCNNDLTETLSRVDVLGKGRIFTLRNGDFVPYAAVWNQIGPMAESIAGYIRQTSGHLWTLEDRGLFVAAQVEIMKVFYSAWRQNLQSGKMAPAIGGPVRYLVVGHRRPPTGVSTATFQ